MAENNFSALVQLIVDKAQARSALQRELKELQREAQLETDVKVNLSDVRQARKEIEKANKEQQQGTRENIKLRAQELAHARMVAKETKVATDLEIANRQREMKLSNQAMSEELANRKRVAQEQKVATQEELASRESIRKLNEQTFKEESSARRQAMAETKLQAQEQRALQSSLNAPEKRINRKLDNDVYSTDIDKLKQKFQDYGLTVEQAETKVKTLRDTLTDMKGLSGDELIKKANEWDNAFEKVKVQLDQTRLAYDQLSEVNKIQHSLDVGDYDAQIETIKKGFIGLSGSANEAETHVKGLRTALKSIHDATDDNGRLSAEKNYQLELEKTHNQLTIAKAKAKEYVDVLKVQKLRNDIQDWLRKNTAATQEAKNAMTTYLNTLDDVGHVSQSSFNEAKQALDNWDTQMRQAGKLGKSLTETFKEGVKSFTSWAISSGAVMEVWNGLKNGLKTIKDLDTALVDLRKTTDATAQELEDFYFSSNETAKQLGVTTSEVINATSAWSRLGYAIEDATTLAKNSAILASISPEMDIDTATDGLVSTLKAFKIEAEDSLDGVISKINIIGNTQAVDNNDVVDILTRSSSAMAEANNTLEETIALGVAATEITRDADAVGNMLKTVSMRIRGRQTLPPYTVMYMLCA